MEFETKAIHAGQDPEPAYGAVSVPIYQTSTYAQESVGKHKGYDYARTGNPTRTALETAMAALEEGFGGLCFASGMAAESTFFYLLSPGDHVIVADDVYGGTYRLVNRVLREAMGIEFDTVDLTDLEALKKALREETRLVWVETPTNPLLKIIDIGAVADLAHEAGAWCAVDNTFASPYLQQPLKLGADAVIHSATKYLGGHSDVVGGAIVTAQAEMHERLAFLQNAVGGVPGPLDCFLVLRGLKTLALRMEAHCRNAQRLATFLSAHPRVRKTYYPGLPDHPGHDIAKRQMRGFGGMVSFETETEQEALDVCGKTKLFFLAESLGGVESLIEHPGRMTHASVAGSPLEVPAALVRLSVGIEHPDDLLEDLAQALG
ncbi:MAG: cystathionine gamma-synthase [Actinobacteria bacterium]|nr:MAG: cystathionine gamma-synthase [Actinomycetota bacterium]